jgi:hypothetical protein
VLACAGFLAWRKYAPALLRDEPEQAAATPEQMVPEGVRIKVEVQNATRVPGLARKATQFLRDRGFDVVAIRTASERRKSTLVLDRSNHPAWALLVARALGARTEPRPDTTRYLDVTVLLGDDWRPPPLPFYP